MMASGNNKIARNTLYLYIRMAFSLVVSLYTSRVVINTLGVVDYGINNVVAGFVSMFAFLNSSLTSSIQRFYNYENGRNGHNGVLRVYEVSIVVQILLSIFICLLLETFGLWYLNNKLVIPPERLFSANVLYQTTVISMLLLILQVPYSALIMSYERMDYYALVGVLDTVLRLLIVFLLPYFPNDKLIVYGFLGLIISAFNFLMYYLYTRHNFPTIRFHLKIDFSLLKSVLSFSFWNTFGAFSIMIRNQGLNILINLFFGPVVNAARGVAYSIQSAMMGFIQNISTSTRPQLTESYAKGNVSRSLNLAFGISKINFILLYLMALPVIGEIHYLLHLWLGDSVPEHTETFAILVLVIALVDVLNTPISIIMLATGKVSRFNTISSVIGLLSLPLSYLLLSYGGNENTIFYVAIFISVMVQIASVKIMCQTVNTRAIDYIKKVIFPLICLIVLTGWIILIPQYIVDDGIIRLLLTILLTTVIIIITSYLVVLNSSERKYVIEFITRKLKKS